MVSLDKSLRLGEPMQWLEQKQMFRSSGYDATKPLLGKQRDTIVSKPPAFDKGRPELAELLSPADFISRRCTCLLYTSRCV